MADRSKDPVVVIGLGRFGTALALELTRRGNEVLAIDHRAKVTQHLAGQITQIATADATDMEALQQLGVPDFTRAVVGIGGDLEASILTASLLVELEIDSIWAKAISRQHGRILDRLGVHHVVFPEHDMGERVAHLVSGRMLDYMQVDDDFALVKTRPPKDYVGIPLGRSNLRRKYGVTIVAVKTRDEGFTYADSETVLTYDDTILVSGRAEQVERFSEL
ncbi:potassium channel family protein [Sphaerisporangium rubeum]|uniref:Trk system potassium uptake protein TrkA n=1 Tax=Sphaerisporangium rubeum TaxID=321317 RepID=A0A7X0IHP5_9ACTN|nr:TrkA family potassium uptake protein [Sphaerisporangium rubeum]MBB6474178.1 trk system potassium uptake protein TrkA [Sphaerisporangium rubeum]